MEVKRTSTNQRPLARNIRAGKSGSNGDLKHDTDCFRPHDNGKHSPTVPTCKDDLTPQDPDTIFPQDYPGKLDGQHIFCVRLSCLDGKCFGSKAIDRVYRQDHLYPKRLSRRRSDRSTLHLSENRRSYTPSGNPFCYWNDTEPTKTPRVELYLERYSWAYHSMLITERYRFL